MKTKVCTFYLSHIGWSMTIERYQVKISKTKQTNSRWLQCDSIEVAWVAFKKYIVINMEFIGAYGLSGNLAQEATLTF